MNILVTIDKNHIHNQILIGLAYAANKCGHPIFCWSKEDKPAFDAFDEFKPDMVWASDHLLDRATVKCLKEKDGIPILIVIGGSFINDGLRLKNTVYANKLHPSQIKNPEIISLTFAADLVNFRRNNAFVKQELQCEYAYFGESNYSAMKYLSKLCNPIRERSIKIFGPTAFPFPQYCGQTNETEVYSSARHSLFISNRMDNTPFNILACGSICLHSKNTNLDLFNLAGTVEVSPETVIDKVRLDNKLNNIYNENYFVRLNTLFNRMNMKHEAEKSLKTLEAIYE